MKKLITKIVAFVLGSLLSEGIIHAIKMKSKNKTFTGKSIEKKKSELNRYSGTVILGPDDGKVT